jgi:aryl-alcohol dehydrogenase-like predicted oxidoreductase
MTTGNGGEHRHLGSSGPKIFPLALGCMGMPGMCGETDENESIATIHAALDSGITPLDTGNFYGMGHNEIAPLQVLCKRIYKAVLPYGNRSALSIGRHLPWRNAFVML